MLSSIRNSNNQLFQETIFLLNLLLRKKRYQYCLRKLPNIRFRQMAELKKKKQSDTIFILGSGSSIAELGKTEFATIAQHDSIGFNFWLLHPYVPTYYTAEFKPSCERSANLWRSLNIRAEDYQHTAVVLKYSEGFQEGCHHLPSNLDEIYLTSQLNIPGNNEDSLAKWLKFLKSKNFFSQNNEDGCIIYRQASISWLITLALRLGYKRIVLCGIDLNKPEYFFDIEKGFIRARGLQVPEAGFKGETHPTESLVDRVAQTPISVVLQIINQTLLKPEGVELLIGSPSSALYPDFSLYDW